MGIGKTTKRFISVCNVFVHNKTVDFGVLREPAEVHLNDMTNPKVYETMLNSPNDLIPRAPAKTATN